MRAGSYHEGELWLRCPYCGDSERHPDKAHFSVSTDGRYYCFRCLKGGRLPMKDLVDLFVRARILDVALKEDLDLSPQRFSELFERLLPGPAISRYSALDRFHLGKQDVFLSRRPAGDLVGLAFAGTKGRRIIGNKGFGFRGDELHSDPEDPIRLVEGPYDVIGDRDVCVFGSISIKALYQLKGHCVILCPDGDIWTDDHKRWSFLRCLEPLRKLGASIVRVERLPDELDPATVPYHERKRLSEKEYLGYLRSRGPSRVR